MPTCFNKLLEDEFGIYFALPFVRRESGLYQGVPPSSPKDTTPSGFPDSCLALERPNPQRLSAIGVREPLYVVQDLVAHSAEFSMSRGGCTPFGRGSGRGVTLPR